MEEPKIIRRDNKLYIVTASLKNPPEILKRFPEWKIKTSKERCSGEIKYRLTRREIDGEEYRYYSCDITLIGNRCI